MSVTRLCFGRALLKPISGWVEPHEDKHCYWIPASAGMTGGFLGKDEGRQVSVVE
ncbi:MAG: hypothetical protein PVH82_19030 [Desulfobacteraceae bacterium]